MLKAGGNLVFTVEHPVFTAHGTQDWYYNEKGEILHFPVDNYYYEGKRTAMFLEEKVTKYHRTLTTYLNTWNGNSFFDKFYKVQNFFPYAIPIVLDNEPPQM